MTGPTHGTRKKSAMSVSIDLIATAKVEHDEERGEYVALAPVERDALVRIARAAEDASICDNLAHCSMCRTLVDALEAAGLR